MSGVNRFRDADNGERKFGIGSYADYSERDWIG